MSNDDKYPPISDTDWRYLRDIFRSFFRALVACTALCQAEDIIKALLP